jgi:2-dehydropantoate 2-reductase
VSELTSEVSQCSFNLGTYDMQPHPWLDEVKKILEVMCPVYVVDNLPASRWTKVCINASMSGMSAVMGGNFGDVLDDEDGKVCAAMLQSETYNSTKASNIDLALFSGAAFADKAGRVAHIENMTGLFKPHRAIVASMLQDLQKGKQCEVKDINGAVADLGDKTGIDTPFNDLVIKLLLECQDGKRKPAKDNLKEFKPLLDKLPK